MSRRLSRIVVAGDLAGDLLRHADRGKGLVAARVCATWREVVGEAVAEHAVAVRLKEGELLVAVDSPAWANELTMLQTEYLPVLQERFGAETIRRIRFTVSKRVAEHRRELPERQTDTRPILPPLDQEEIDRIAAQVSTTVADEDLRESIARAMIADRRAKKAEEGDAGR